MLAQSEEVALPPGQFHLFDFRRDDLPVAGEEGTGRVQVGVDFQFQVDAQQTFSAKDFPVTIELMDGRSGGDYFCGSVTVSGD